MRRDDPNLTQADVRAGVWFQKCGRLAKASGTGQGAKARSSANCNPTYSAEQDTLDHLVAVIRPATMQPVGGGEVAQLSMFEEDAPAVELKLPQLDYGPVKSAAGQIRASLRAAETVSAVLVGEVHVSPRVKEPMYALPSGEHVVVTTRKAAPPEGGRWSTFLGRRRITSLA